MRLFVAAWPPEPVVSVLAALERPSVEGVRWTAPEQWHVTLRFLGDVDASSVDDVVSSLAAAASGLAPARAVMGPALAALALADAVGEAATEEGADRTREDDHRRQRAVERLAEAELGVPDRTHLQNGEEDTRAQHGDQDDA